MSPGSAAETVFGRRGGGWAPKPAPATDTPAKPKDPADRWCGLCLALGRQVKIADHPTDLCDACGGYRCHHQDDDEDLCWEGRARMARAKADTGGHLNDVELRALARHPDPPMLTIGGYVLDTSRTDAGFFKKATG
jgi:hypothetical protein